MGRARKTNGYILVYCPTHPKAIRSGSWEGYMYEHRLVAEETLGRTLTDKEVVHHIDGNRINNSPENLIVMSNAEHSRLHALLRSTVVRMTKRCPSCKKIFVAEENRKYCSLPCSKFAQRKVERPTKEILIEEIKNMSWVGIGRKYGVSDNAIRKWARAYKLL